MRQIAEDYYRTLEHVIGHTAVTDAQGLPLSLCEGIERAGRLVVAQTAAGAKLLFIGNGANAGISSHMASDFCKNAGIAALAFNDPALLTAVGNDFGFENTFLMPLKTFAKAGDVLVALSSSGASPNILKAVEWARANGCRVITLSGFRETNPLRPLGEINFYAPSGAYALVEVVHHSICHCLLHAIVTARENPAARGQV